MSNSTNNIENQKLKILYIHHGRGIGGAPISLLNLVKNIDKDKFTCKVAFIEGGEILDFFKDEGIETEVINGRNNWFIHNKSEKKKFWYFFKYIKIYLEWLYVSKHEAKKYLEKQNVDIVHLNSHALTSWAYSARKQGIKVVLHNREAVSNGFLGVRLSVLKKTISKNCDAIINISRDNYKRLGIEENSFVVYNFIDIPKKFKERIHPKNKKYKVLYLGGSSTIKGFGTAVKCLKYLDRNIIVQFAGNLSTWKPAKNIMQHFKNIIKLTVYRRRYKPLKTLHESENAEIIGLLKDPTPYIAQCAFLITPFKIEHFSRPAVEAFAYGKPVIGSNVEGMDEIIDHGINGLLHEKNNPKALAEAINYLCKNPELVKKMGLNAREKAEAFFSPKINTRKVEAIYSSLIKK